MEFDPVSFAMGVSSASVDPELADATATRADILYPKTAYLANGHKNTGTMQSLAAATFTPSTATQTIPAGKYLAGDQTILGDTNLTPENIRNNITLFGVTGTYGGGSEADSTKPVRFIDYDGTILYSYTSAEFASLSALPANPSHTGLVAQGWNWNLNNAKTYVASYGSLDIGQMYTTASGATEIDITLEAPNLSPYLIVTITSSVTIDWGDGSATESIYIPGKNAIQHTYAQGGNYTISLTGSVKFKKFETFTNAGVLSATQVPSRSSLYSSTIKAIRLNDTAIIDFGAFAYCTQLQYVTIPEAITETMELAFYCCYSLKTIVIPNTFSTIAQSVFRDCTSLEIVCIPHGITGIYNSAFQGCQKLQRISLPTSITLIKVQAFDGCSSLEKAIIPSSVGSFEDSIFANCSSLSSAIVESSYSNLYSNIFNSCKNLKTVTLSNAITSISENAFANCISLQGVSISPYVTQIGANAFGNCYSLSSIHFLRATPPIISNSNAFSNLPANCIIYVPSGSLSAYTSATNYPSSSTYTYVEE